MPAETGATTSRLLNRLAYDVATIAADVVTVATGDLIPIYDLSTEKMTYATPRAIRDGQLLSQTPVSLTVTTILTKAAHEGRPLLMGAAGAALTFTLPAATGSGDRYRFFVSVVNTSNYLIKASAGSMLFKGTIVGASVTDSATDAARTWIAGATDDTITLNGTTTGGTAIGNWIEIEDCSAVFWAVRGMVGQSGAEATPFSDTVT